MHGISSASLPVDWTQAVQRAVNLTAEPEVPFESVLQNTLAAVADQAQIMKQAQQIAIQTTAIQPPTAMAGHIAQLIQTDDEDDEEELSVAFKNGELAQIFPSDGSPEGVNVISDERPVRSGRPEVVGRTALGLERLSVTPFQLFLDKAVELFDRVSALETRADQLMEDYANGRASLDEMAVEKAKAGVAVSFAVNLVNQVSQIFKEIQNMPI